jgi:hypothetical protein
MAATPKPQYDEIYIDFYWSDAHSSFLCPRGDNGVSTARGEIQQMGYYTTHHY